MKKLFSPTKAQRVVASVTMIASLVFFANIGWAEAAIPGNSSFPQNGSIQGRWLLDEETGTRADISGNGNTLADNNSVLAGDGISEAGASSTFAADFELSTTEYLSITDGSQTGLDITGDMTVMGWVNVELAPGLYALWGKASEDSYRCFYRATTKIQCDIFDTSSNESQGSKSLNLVAGTWYHVAVQIDVSVPRVEIWVDGVDQDATQDVSNATAIHSGNGDFNIGAQAGATQFDGRMQDVIIWDAKLTDAEMVEAYEVYTVAAAAAGGGPVFFLFQAFHMDLSTHIATYA